MQTAKRVMILLAVALTGVAAMAMQTGQDNSAKSQQPAQRRFSGTRSASCIVRITADPVIIPLDPATVQGLLYSSGVAAQAVREVLQLDSMENPCEELIEMEWLNESSSRPSPRATSANEGAAAYDEEMVRQPAKVYGADYLRQQGLYGPRTKPSKNQPNDGSSDDGGRYGTRSGENPPDPLSPSRSAPGGTPSATIRLSVHLPDGVPLAADEFLRAVISNLRSSLRYAYEVYISDLGDQLTLTRGQHDSALDTQQGGTNPAAVRTKEQLDTIVDLSALTPEMPIAEAVEIMKKSVAPPLNIVVLWNDLMDSLQVEPSTPINIGGMQNVRLGTALDLLVRGMPAVQAKPMWRIKGDVMVIGTVMTLGESNESVGPPNIDTDVRALAAQRTNLVGRLQDLEMSLAGQEARRKATAEQIARTRNEAQERLAEDEVTKELESLVRLSAENLSNLRKHAEAGRAPTAELRQATESLTRARIELARRREELSKQVGGGQLEQLSSEMSRAVIDRAEREAQQEILRRQLAQVQQQLAQASAFDPEAARMRMVREELDILSRRITELQARIANLQPPMVTVIGAN